MPAGDSKSAPDPQTVLAEIKDEVRRRREAGEYPRALLDRISRAFEFPEERQDPELFAVVDTVRPLRSDRPVIGPAITFTKRAVRRLLAWYVQPIAHEQTEFNLALLRQLRKLEDRVAGVSTVWSPRQTLTTAALRAAAPARARALLDTGADLSRGLAIVGGDAPLLAELDRLGITASSARAEDEVAWVASLARAPKPVLYIAGALGRATPADSLHLLQHARRALMPTGVLVADAPVRPPSWESDPAVIDVTMRRWVAPEAMTVLMETAGLESPRRVDIAAPESGGAAWYMVTCTTPRQ